MSTFDTFYTDYSLAIIQGLAPLEVTPERALKMVEASGGTAEAHESYLEAYGGIMHEAKLFYMGHGLVSANGQANDRVIIREYTRIQEVDDFKGLSGPFFDAVADHFTKQLGTLPQAIERLATQWLGDREFVISEAESRELVNLAATNTEAFALGDGPVGLDSFYSAILLACSLAAHWQAAVVLIPEA